MIGQVSHSQGIFSSVRTNKSCSVKNMWNCFCFFKLCARGLVVLYVAAIENFISTNCNSTVFFAQNVAVHCRQF